MEQYRESWPAPHPVGGVLLIHGIGEHCNRYARLVGPLNAAGFTVYGFDLRGHGRSPGRRGHILAWRDYLDDVEGARAWAVRENGGLPFFLFGHSMGALIALDHLLERAEGVRAAAVTGLPFAPVGVAHPLKVAVARFLSCWWPAFTIPLGIKTGMLTADEAEASEAYDDPFTHGRISVRWGVEILGAIERIKREVVALRVPLFIGHGGDDPINDPAGAQQLEACLAVERRLVLYPGSRHEILHDHGHERLSRDVVDWFQRHT